MAGEHEAETDSVSELTDPHFFVSKSGLGAERETIRDIKRCSSAYVNCSGSVICSASVFWSAGTRGRGGGGLCIR